MRREYSRIWGSSENMTRVRRSWHLTLELSVLVWMPFAGHWNQISKFGSKWYLRIHRTEFRQMSASTSPLPLVSRETTVWTRSRFVKHWRMIYVLILAISCPWDDSKQSFITDRFQRCLSDCHLCSVYLFHKICLSYSEFFDFFLEAGGSFERLLTVPHRDARKGELMNETSDDLFVESSTKNKRIVTSNVEQISLSGIQRRQSIAVDFRTAPSTLCGCHHWKNWEKSDWSSVNFTDFIRESISHCRKFFTWWDFVGLGVESSDICEGSCSYHIKWIGTFSISFCVVHVRSDSLSNPEMTPMSA
jgi:hypothetical protein